MITPRSSSYDHHASLECWAGGLGKEDDRMCMPIPACLLTFCFFFLLFFRCASELLQVSTEEWNGGAVSSKIYGEFSADSVPRHPMRAQHQQSCLLPLPYTSDNPNISLRHQQFLLPPFFLEAQKANVESMVILHPHNLSEGWPSPPLLTCSKHSFCLSPRRRSHTILT